ncbi:DUF1205 domain-containing protein [Micromonospora yasonensis]|uniref:nucleotide disphospho-sugar-binding domain-containing protein n=1 Tax=Micromonospora yasonensis TaxID=1128667 RepID=UPI002230F749|nr:nucleotide disphospho-sugar-binding domain-containing protein [Micromonospora yasonensis]MCW3840372.1 DUF1205 domain-containing protein [Micromonospora yasonensis]
MRVLFIATPGIGHVYPMVPLAWAFRTAGHEVLIGTSGLGLPVTSAGLDVANIAPQFEPPAFWQPVMIKLSREHPELAPQMAAMRSGKVEDQRFVAPFLAKLSGFLADGAMKVAEDWKPDLVVQSRSQGAGLVVAGKLGVPLVDHGIGLSRTPELHDIFHQHMTDVFERHGVTGLPETRLGLDLAPASMIDGEHEGWPMRFVPYNGGVVLPEWLNFRPERPRIAVTLGTVSTLEGTGMSTLERVIRAAEKVDAEFVLALGETDLSALGTLPENVRVAGWLPLAALLPSCAAMIHHGGGSTTLTTLAAGVPQLIVPDGADRHINAAAVGRRGAGLVTEPDAFDAALVAEVLSDERFRTAAAEVHAEIRAMPSPTDLVRRLTDQVAGRRSATAG